jgi:hypothetical protein
MRETWAQGVIARYLTVGGATVDLTYRLNFLTPPEPFATAATCTGCPKSKEFGHWRNVYQFDGGQAEKHCPEAAETDARAWAQSHAEKCRAMPRPTA